MSQVRGEGFGSSSTTQPPPPAGQSNVIRKPADPVVVNGKKAADLSSDEMETFLSSKITNVQQSEDNVISLHLAPGYALTLTFDAPPQSVIVGDPALMTYKPIGRTLVLSAHQRRGDTSMQVIFPGNRVFVYHVFIASSFVDAQSAVKVTTEESSPNASSPYGSSRRGSPYEGSLGADDVKSVANVIANYDALIQEGVMKRGEVKRVDVFRHSDSTSFTTYCIYRFRDGKAAISFAYTNPYRNNLRYDESRLRVQIKESLFIPDYVSFQHLQLGPSETTTGFLILSKPPFSFDQPFEIVWE